jgi:hypothetical protein
MQLPHTRLAMVYSDRTLGSTLGSAPTANLAVSFQYLIAFNRLICPSIGPLLHGVVIDSFTASRSRHGVLANWAVNRNPETVADSIHVFSLLALRQRSMARNWRTNRRGLRASGQKHERV